MGFLNYASKVGRKLFEKIKKPLNTVYGWAKDGANFMQRGADWVDQHLNKLHNIPVLGELASVVQMHPIYKGLLEGVDEVGRFVDLVGTTGRDIGKGIDAALGALERSGGRGGVGPLPTPIGSITRANNLTERSVPFRQALSGANLSSQLIG